MRISRSESSSFISQTFSMLGLISSLNYMILFDGRELHKKEKCKRKIQFLLRLNNYILQKKVKTKKPFIKSYN